MSEFQATLFGPSVIPLQKMTVKERAMAAALELGVDAESCDIAIAQWMLDPWVNALIFSIPAIRTTDEAREAYIDHLRQKTGCFEGEARQTRNAKRDLKNGSSTVDKKRTDQIRKGFNQPKWYARYLKSRHWTEPVYGVKPGALMYYGSCVLCGSTKELQTHHRHYNSIGKEDSHDVSILCDSHHRQVTKILGMCIPRVIPPGAITVFRKEGTDITDLEDETV